MDQEIRQIILSASQRKLNDYEYQKLRSAFEEERPFRNLRKVIKWAEFGELSVTLHQGVPTIATRVAKDIKLDTEEVNLRSFNLTSGQ